MNNSEQPLPDGDKLKLAAGFLNALRSRDWQAMRNILTEDASWTLPGTSVLSGKSSGVDAVIKKATMLRDYGVMVELLHILYSMSGVALSLHNTASRGNLQLDEYVVIAMELRGGKISSLNTHLHDVAGINAFFIEGIL